MELSKKTTILFPPNLHDHLVQLAQRMGVSLGELVRRACEAQYGILSEEERVKAVAELASLALPVGETGTMKRESTAEPDELLP